MQVPAMCEADDWGLTTDGFAPGPLSDVFGFVDIVRLRLRVLRSHRRL